jgi:hypothetical protein
MNLFIFYFLSFDWLLLVYHNRGGLKHLLTFFTIIEACLLTFFCHILSLKSPFSFSFFFFSLYIYIYK